MKLYIRFLLFLLLGIITSNVYATKFVELKVVDKDYLMLYFKDGEVKYVENTTGPNAYTNNLSGRDDNELVTYGTALTTASVPTLTNWAITSTNDANFGTTGLAPTAVYRKSKLNGLSQEDWNSSTNDFNYQWAYDHRVFLKLPKSMTQGKTYTVKINAALNSDNNAPTITFNIFNSPTEAIKVNLVGYTSGSVKAVDLYEWMGDGGARDYSSFVGKKVYVYNTATNTSQAISTVSLWKSKAREANNHQLIASDVWRADISAFTTPGTYRVAIEGVGCSQDFVISNDAYFNPYMVSVRGFYYMRIGEDKATMSPAPRQPQWIQDKNPSDCKIYITTMHPYHASWSTLSTGDKWDAKETWAPYVKAGNPTNPNAYGGHSDALDWDRHLGHVSIIYDMLLPYYVTGGNLRDDNLGIPESGNGIPDIIDEARNEVDFWLRLRDGKGYSHGINNPTNQIPLNILYQAGTTGVAAWANALNAAMLASCFKLSGHTALMERYRDSAINAYAYANSLATADQMLDKTQDIGAGIMSGKDFKVSAAAFLYNITGNTTYETDLKNLSSVTSASSSIYSGSSNQLYSVAGYLFTQQKINQTTLYNNMKSAIVAEAKSKEANYTLSRPSRRASDNDHGWFQTEMVTQRTIIAHAISADGADKQLFADALTLEADWTLGRNPANMIQMTTATTPLASKRSVEYAYTSGWQDGVPGCHPGHTPYLNVFDWGGTMWMGNPSKMTAYNYPACFVGGNATDQMQWPYGELYYNTRYIYSANEFTPQQTMRGKMALYGYLYGQGPACDRPNLGDDLSICGATSLTLNTNLSAAGRSFAWKKDGQAITGQTGNTLVATSAGEYEVTSTEGTCVKTDKITVLSTMPKPSLGIDQTLCNPSSVALNAGVAGSGLSFAWFKDGVLIKNASTAQYTVYDKGVYALKISATGCTTVGDTIAFTSNLLSVVHDTLCKAGTATVKSANATGTFSWYSALTGGTALASGVSFSTPITSDTVFYLEDANGFAGSFGPASPDDYKATGSDSKIWNTWGNEATEGMKFQVLKTLTLKSVAVFLGTATSVTVRILGSDNTTVVHTVTQAASGTSVVMNLNKELTAGTYYIDAKGTNGTVKMNGDGSNVPALSTIKIDGLIAITGTYPDWAETNKRWNFFYNWQVTAGNACARTPVRAIIDPTKNCGSTTVTQTIALAAGWNLISTNVSPNDSTIVTLFKGLDVIEIKDMNSFWRKGQDDAFNGLKTITTSEGYLVNMNAIGTLTLTGLQNLQGFKNLEGLNVGWALIGYPYQSATAIANSFNATNCSAIKDFNGFWIPSGTTNSLQSLIPGKGYFIKK